jgi:hypothetical protein
MLVRAVAGVHDAGVEEACEENAALRSHRADDNDIRVQGSRLRAGVLKSFRPFLATKPRP